MRNETTSVSFQWDVVSAVEMFKRDLVTTDCICLTFETPDGWIELDEDMKGWSVFLDEVESFLPNFPPQEKWYEEVLRPPFATNHARLWTRSQKTQNDILQAETPRR